MIKGIMSATKVEEIVQMNTIIDSSDIDERRRSITTSSINSNKVSIKSIDRNDDSSNYSDSDSDLENVLDNNQNVINNMTHTYAMNIGVVPSNKIIDPNNISNSNVLCAKDATERPNIGSIAMQNCNDVTFGDKTYISGNLIVKQYIQTDDRKKRQIRWKECDDVDNSAYAGSTNKVNQIQNGSFKSMDHPDDIEKKWKWTRKRAPMIALVATICLLVLTLMIIILKFSSGPDTTSEPSSSTIMFPNNISGVTRDEWNAERPSSPLTDQQLPAERVIITHTVTENCSTQAECTILVQSIQKRHMKTKGCSDIRYNFLVGGDGSIYEGRGWRKLGAHTLGHNKQSIGFAFIGTFNTVLPPPYQIEAAKKMIAHGVQKGVLAENYKLYGLCQLRPSKSPGAALFKEIKKWDHWSALRYPCIF